MAVYLAIRNVNFREKKKKQNQQMVQYLGSRNPTALNTPINHEAGPSLDWVAWMRNIAVERACCFVGSE